MPLFDRDLIARARALREAWEADELRAFTERQPEARPDSRTGPGRPGAGGASPPMCRGRLWTMRQIAGLGPGEDTNGRFRYLIEQEQTGLSVDFDMPTL